MTSIGGFGGVKIEIRDVGEAVFGVESASGRFVPKQIFVERETVNHKLIRKHEAFGGTIECSLMNLATNDWEQFQQLYALFNYSAINEVPVDVYPAWDSSLVNCPGYSCLFDAELDLQQLKRYEAGQQITIKFKLAAPLNQIPFYTAQLANIVIKTRDDLIIITRDDEQIAIRR